MRRLLAFIRIPELWIAAGAMLIVLVVSGRVIPQPTTSPNEQPLRELNERLQQKAAAIESSP